MSLKLYTEPSKTAPFWTNAITRHIPHTRCETPEEADFVVSTKIPSGSQDVTLIQTTLHSYRDTDHRVLVFLLSDYNEPLRWNTI